MQFIQKHHVAVIILIVGVSLIAAFVPMPAYAVAPVVAAALAMAGSILGFLIEILAKTATIIFFLIVGLDLVISAFEFVLTYLTLGMGELITGSASEAIRSGWTIIRDIANIGIIAGLVATAIGTIVQSGTYNINKTLARLIIAALLVNFSYFFAAVIIDASNLLSAKIYQAVIVKYCGPALQNECFSERVLGVTKLDALEEKGFKQFVKGEGTAKGGSPVLAPFKTLLLTAFYNILIIFFTLILIFYFFQAVALFGARFVILVFLLITSPIGIAGVAIPILKKYADDWWTALFTQAIYPSVFLLIAGIGMGVLEKINPAVGGQGENTFVGLIVAFGLSVAFLMIASKIAGDISNKAAAFKDVYKFMKRFDASSWYGRNTVGWASHELARIYNQRVAPALYKYGGDVVGGAIDRGIKNVLESGAKEKFGGEKSFEDMKKERKAREIEVSDIEVEEKLKKDVGTANEVYKNAQEKFDAKWATKEDRRPGESLKDYRKRLENETGLADARARVQGALNALPEGAIDRMYDEDPKKVKELARALTPQQFLALLENKGIKRSLKKKMREDRFKALIEETNTMQARLDSGEVVYDSDEYLDWKEDMFLQKRDFYSTEELTDLVLSTAGQDLRSKLAFIDTATNGFYDALRKNPKIARSEVDRIIDPLKRKVYRDAQIESVLAQKVLGNDALIDPGDNTEMAREERKQWWEKQRKLIQRIPEERARIAQKIADAKARGDAKAVELLEEKDQALADRLALYQTIEKNGLDTIESGTSALQAQADALNKDRREGKISEAEYNTRSEAIAEEQAVFQRHYETSSHRVGSWAEGKAGHEVNVEMKDEHLENPLIAQHISADQLEHVDRDRNFMESLRDNVLTYGNDEAVNYILNNPYGQKKFGRPDEKKLKEINKKRKLLGRGTVDEARQQLASGGSQSAPKNPSGAKSLPEDEK